MTGRTENLRKEFDLTLRWTAFPLHPETPDEGRSLEDLFAGRGVDMPAVMERLKRTADALGLPFSTRTMTFNSRAAQELGKWAEAGGRGDSFHRLVFAAYFVHGRNIAKWEVLEELVRAVGLDPAAAEDVLARRIYAKVVDRDWQRSRDMGITAVPTFVMGGQRLVGAQSDLALRGMALAAGAAPRASSAST